MLSNLKSQISDISNWLNSESFVNSAVNIESSSEDKENRQETLMKDENELTQKLQTFAITGFKNIETCINHAVCTANIVANKASASIKKTVEECGMLSEFCKMQENFLQTTGDNSKDAVPPWLGYPNEDELREKCLALSLDRRNFIRNPPPGVAFNFTQNLYKVAETIMLEDRRLVAMRYELVPKKVSEQQFWQNYFYRIGLILQDNEVSLLMKEEEVRKATENHNSPPIEDLELDEGIVDDEAEFGLEQKPYSTNDFVKTDVMVSDSLQKIHPTHLGELDPELSDFEVVGDNTVL